MRFQTLTIAAFRIFKEKRVTFAPQINLILGPNAVGKTSLIEALYLLMTGRSFRSLHLPDLIHQGSALFCIEGEFEKNGFNQFLKMRFDGKEKQFLYNSSSLQSASSLLGILQGVLLAPHDIELIKGPPQIRRQFLDLQIAQVDPLYVHHLLRYTKGLKQRNWMLKTKQLQAIDAYEVQLAQSATFLIQQRKRLVLDLEKTLGDLYQQISGHSESLKLSYHSSLGNLTNQEEIALKLRQTRTKDLELGSTSIGPHRDDVKIILNDREAKSFASEGEMRTIACALRLSEWKEIRKITHEDPLLFVDDFGMSLDEKRMSSLSNLFTQLGQIIITSVNPILAKSQVHHIEI